MTGKLVNLRREKKRRARAADKAEADRNAVRHGTPKALRELDAARTRRETARLDGHRLERGEDDDEPGGDA